MYPKIVLILVEKLNNEKINARHAYEWPHNRKSKRIKNIFVYYITLRSSNNEQTIK